MCVDESYMRRALELARRGEGLTRPNPPVGAVLVLAGEIIAEGWHQKAGGPHAEVNCLANLKSPLPNLQSATLYVTLEPCSTQGRTPPCTDLIIEQGIGRVVVAVKDMNPQHAGRGLDLLREAGVEVVSGVCEKEGRALIEPFEKFITTGRPYITLKLAITLDGKIADRLGHSKWITGADAREQVQQMRRRADAIMVGAATIRADDPSLLPRPAEGRHPWRVVVGDNVPASAKVLVDAESERTLFYNGNVEAMFRDLAEEHDVMHVLCEGGGRLATKLIDAGLVDEFVFFVAPKLMGSDGIPSFAATGSSMAGIRKLRYISVERVGEDLMIRAKREE